MAQNAGYANTGIDKKANLWGSGLNKKKQTMRGGDEIDLKSALANLINASGLKGRMIGVELGQRWEEIAGRMVARHTTEIYMKNNMLFIKFDSSVVRHEVSMMKSKLLEKLNQALGQGDIIKDLRLF
ncbi:MAG: DUF721 domain-containing protein [Bacteroidetes bacterium]|jgi:predicted nucleic acid-binding Zn ribbon protein|nr:DUF721 domain-containing protein [Bacteroidota bacterium]